MDSEATDASTQQNPEQIDEEFTTTAYPNVQENLKLPTEDQVIIEEPASSTGTMSSLQNLDKKLSFTNQFFVEKPQEEEPEKTNTESEVQSMVMVPIHQNTSSVPPMTSPVINLTVLHPVSTTIHAPLPTSTTVTATTTTTSLPPPPPQTQQSTTYPILVHRIGELEQHMADLVSKAVDEIVTDAVNWAMQAPLRARFRDLHAVDMKEILQQRMFEDKSYEAHEDHKNLYDALQKSLERDYANQLLANLDKARKKKRKRRTSRASGSSQLPSPPPPPSTSTSGSAQQQDNKAQSSFTATQETSPSDDLMQDDSILDEHVHLSDDDDSENDHPLKDNLRKDWWKPLPEEDRPATPEPAWTILSSNVSDVENNWAFALVSTYEPPAKNSLLTKIGDMTTFMNRYCQKVNKTVLTQADFERQAYEVVKAFYPDVIYLELHMEEYHKMLIDQVDWTNPEGDQVRVDVNRPLPLGGPPGHVTIQTQFFFNKDLEYLRYGSKGNSPALSISKMKAASYPDFGLELLVSEQMWIDNVCTYDISAKYGISHWWFNRQKFYIDRHDSPSHRKEVRTHIFQEPISSDFEDLNLLLLQGHLDHLPGSEKRMLSTAVNLTKPGWDAKGCEFKHDYTIIESPRAVVFPVDNNEQKITRFNEIYKFSDGTLTRILEAMDYRVKEFKIKRLNPGINTRFWTKKYVTRSKEFIAAIERRLKMRRIYQNLECFVGGRVRDIDYILLQRME
ncbi:hypothetical protein Tco_0092007 [Tanacetum coccineum]